MSIKYKLIVSFIFSLGSITPMHADIYKCKGKDGEINFTSVPCGQKAAGIKRPEKKKLLNADGSRKTAQQEISERLKKEKAFLEASKRQREDEKRKQLKLEQHQKKIDNNCTQAKQDLARYDRSQYLYSKDKKGNKIILSDNERDVAMQNARRRISFWCR